MEVLKGTDKVKNSSCCNLLWWPSHPSRGFRRSGRTNVRDRC